MISQNIPCTVAERRKLYYTYTAYNYFFGYPMIFATINQDPKNAREIKFESDGGLALPCRIA